MRKLFCCFVLLAILFYANHCQSQALTLRGGRTAIPGDHFAVRYEGVTNTPLSWSATAFAEFSNRKALRYSAYGIDLLLSYPLNNADGDAMFSLKPSLGITAMLENEPWIYAGYEFSKRMNYGITGELIAAWRMTDEFSLSGFLQQQYLFNKNLGSIRFAFGIGLSIHFNQ